MQSVVRLLFLLHDDERLQRNLESIPRRPSVQRVPDWAALRAALRRAPPSAVSVVDPFSGAGEEGGLAEDLRDLLREFPGSVVLAALPVTPRTPPLLRTLLEWGVSDFIDTVREDTPAALGRRLETVRSRSVEHLLRRALPHGVPSRTRAVLMVAAEVVATGGQAPEMAAALGISARTIPRWCERADLPPPRRLLAWLRVLLAADLLDDPRRSIEGVARACGYAGGPALKTALRNLLAATPRSLRERGAFETTAKAFAAELFQLREGARARGKPEQAWLH